MSGLLGKKWPVPIAGPMYPFFIAGGVIYYGIWKAQNAMMDSEEFRNDPRNPAVKRGGATHGNAEETSKGH